MSSTYVYTTVFLLAKVALSAGAFPGCAQSKFYQREALPRHFFPHNEVCKHFLPNSFTGLFSSFWNCYPLQIPTITQCSELSYSVALLNALSWVIEDLGLLGVTSS